MKHFLSVADLDAATLQVLLDRAQGFKDARADHARPLKGRSIGMLFEKPSTRTRISFEVAISELGGHPLVLSGADLQLGRGETLEDTARTVSRYLHGFVVRTFEQQRLELLASHSTIPIVNALSDTEHPCQTLADLLTLRQRFGTLSELEISYIGDGNNVANSLIIGCALAGIQITVVTPAGFEPSPAAVEAARALGGRVTLSDDPTSVKCSRAIYTDVWTSMGQEEEAEQRRQRFADYQIDATLLEQASADAIVLHCLPAHRGEEISPEVFEAHAQVIFDQAENRLHVQKAILEHLI
ncbi:MAG: ornithine carbamoyltransferase [Actinomycetota bacterium]